MSNSATLSKVFTDRRALIQSSLFSQYTVNIDGKMIDCATENEALGRIFIAEADQLRYKVHLFITRNNLGKALPNAVFEGYRGLAMANNKLFALLQQPEVKATKVLDLIASDLLPALRAVDVNKINRFAFAALKVLKTEVYDFDMYWNKYRQSQNK